jgi:hypothetical protein
MMYRARFFGHKFDLSGLLDAAINAPRPQQRNTACHPGCEGASPSDIKAVPIRHTPWHERANRSLC